MSERKARQAPPGSVFASEVFARLRDVLLSERDGLHVVRDGDGDCYVESKKPDSKGKPVFFGAVAIKKGYVAYHLMPVYTHPALLESVSTELKRRMQGKSCFNFKSVDDALFRELATLTRSAFDAWKAEGKI